MWLSSRVMTLFLAMLFQVDWQASLCSKEQQVRVKLGKACGWASLWLLFWLELGSAELCRSLEVEVMLITRLLLAI